MKNRRNFLKHAGAFALGTLLLPACNSPKTNTEAGAENETAAADSADAGANNAAKGNLGAIGLQLYSVKDVLEKDLKGTLQQLASIGYTEAESYPGQQGHYYGMEAKAFGDMLRDMGITLVSSHVGSGNKDSKPGAWQQANLMQNFPELAAKAAETGQKYITCSSLDGSLRKTTDDLKRTAELFNKSGETAKNAGLQFAYHNHAFEFEKIGDVMVYDYLLENTDPELVKYELDLFWVVNGGQDPLAYFSKYPNRFPLCHVKDMDKQDKSKNTEIGSGAINYQQILKAAKEAGMKHYLVEQESFTRPSIESMRMNYNYLAGLTV
ncbi:sugar phosphate isomerase/epimerase family protein [Adhaeribacter rhizoryzae]|uniref:Sugar phosphate isomerase/epimerase n=1 Tax=Adhaeribacter rhizoryzae TaxID=2607907 RepID=A0A5M6D9C6_9BACT|nr:sugar phosphate isomerase/epimerase [Adhaeribacter rhizoryzae]KAA5542892.1 sugar phosphate isomerase/epimerase [Adhaeribacter rhizoryzae]